MVNVELDLLWILVGCCVGAIGGTFGGIVILSFLFPLLDLLDLIWAIADSFVFACVSRISDKLDGKK